MKKKYDYDAIVLGSGPAGSTAALTLAKSGLKTALVESDSWGGSALNGYDLLSNASFRFSHLYHEARLGRRFGLSSSNLRYNFPTVTNWNTLALRRASINYKKPFESAGVACLSGFASFLSPYEIAVKNKTISAPRFIIATGARPLIEQISGVESATCLSPADALRLSKPPKSVFVVGAGSTGCELANYFAELGSSVTIADLADRLLPREDKEVAQCLSKYFASSLKIKILTQSRVIAVVGVQKAHRTLEKSVSNLQRVIFLYGGQEKSASAEVIVLATGSLPALDIGLENAGVAFSRNGITVNENLRTSMKHIYAAGDCIGGDSSIERANYEGTLAATNLIGRSKITRQYEYFIHLTATYPSVASVGLKEDDCLRKKIRYKKAVLPLSSVSASNAYDFRVGFIKLLADSKGKILGATVICPQADLVIEEVVIAIRHKFTVDMLASTSHIASSWNELVHLAADKLAKL